MTNGTKNKRGIKKMKNNKKKSLPLLLLALLMISVGAYGTRAYFSDSAEQNGDIKLVLGELSVSFDAKEWKYTGDSEDIKIVGHKDKITQGTTVENVKPGDRFTREITLRNDGDLNQKVVVTNLFDTSDTRYDLSIESNYLSSVKIKNPKLNESSPVLYLKPNEEVKATITVEIPTELKQVDLLGKDRTLDFIKSVIKAEATQANNASDDTKTWNE